MQSFAGETLYENTVAFIYWPCLIILAFSIETTWWKNNKAIINLSRLEILLCWSSSKNRHQQKTVPCFNSVDSIPRNKPVQMYTKRENEPIVYINFVDEISCSDDKCDISYQSTLNKPSRTLLPPVHLLFVRCSSLLFSLLSDVFVFVYFLVVASPRKTNYLWVLV